MSQIAGGPQNPFAVLTLVAAPALLTNASCLLAMSTSNRFIRVSDRIRLLSAKVDSAPPDEVARLGPQVERVERQGILLLGALRSIYISVGSFAAATLASILGAGLAASATHFWFQACVVIALAVGVVGFAGLIWSNVNLLRATQLSMLNVTEEAAFIRQKAFRAKNPGP